MRRRVAATLLAVIVLAIGGLVGWRVTVSHGAASASEEADQEQLVHRGVTTCGVERWAVKTGIDRAAKSVKTKNVVNTTIAHLGSLTPPSADALPAMGRIRPTEYTVFRVSGYLLRVKQEADSDYHLVLTDTGGHTMIAEIPAPQCVGHQSPFVPQISYVRRVFQSRFHPTPEWVRGKWAVQVTGVGFFDVPHGQSGVAPNAIELHPVLGVKFLSGVPVGSPPPPPSSKPTPTSSTHASGSLAVSAAVSPNPVRYGHTATLTAKSVKGASCSAGVLYASGHAPKSFHGTAQTVGSHGSVSWSWTVDSKSSSGTATVSCTYRGSSRTVAAAFTIS